MSERRLFEEIVVFDNYEIIKLEEGEMQLKTVVTEKALNPYGYAHGGFLYTLCDTVAGGTAATLHAYTVTLQSSINYIKSACLKDELLVIGKCIHNGKSTKVIETKVYNQKEELLCSCQSTMYKVGDMKEDIWNR